MKAALAVVFALIVAAVVAQLAHETTRLAGSNNVRPDAFVVTTKDRVRLCQAHETLFEQTAFVRMTIGTYRRPGPALDAVWEKDGRVLARAGRDRGWQEGVVRLPLEEPPTETTKDVTVCFQVHDPERLAWAGEKTDRDLGSVTVESKRKRAKLSMVSELAGSRSLFGVLDLAASRYGAGNASWLGDWTFWGTMLLFAGALAAAAAALLRRNDRTTRRVPPAAWLCALAALLACATWAVLTPPFHVPDEISHTAYVQAIAESGELPLQRADEPHYSEQERELLASLDFGAVVGRRDSRPPWTGPQEAGVRAAEDEPASREVSNATTASANPPLYYLAEAPVYWATPSTSLLDKLLAMRLFSALLGAVTVLAIFLFLRELVPGSPWLWPAGALVCALQPGFGFISAGVNPDALLFAASATTFWLMARVLRRGASTRRVAALGAVVAMGVLTKPLFIGLVPAAAIAVLIAILRAHRSGAPPRDGLKVLGVGALVAAVPVLAYEVIGRAAFGHPYFAEGRSVEGTVGTNAGSLTGEISYVWQLFLPRVPGTSDQLPGVPLRDTWLDGFAGQFGWLDYTFRPWVLDSIAWIGLGLLVAALISLSVHRRRLRGRWVELGIYALALGGIAIVIGSQDYTASHTSGSVRFTQARYLMPALALYGGLVAVALRLGRGRVGPYLAVAAVGLAALHELSALLLTVTRYYL
jgi:hypothetical protein